MRFGYLSSGRRRYRCRLCKQTFTRNTPSTVSWKDFCDFTRLVKGRANRADILAARSCSRPTLSLRFGFFLDHPLSAEDVWQILPPKTVTRDTLWVLGCDGKWLGRLGVFFIHRNVTTGENLFWSFMASETYAGLFKDCSKLAVLLDGNLPHGAVSDWKGAIVSAVSTHFGSIPHQRCLAHVLRQAKRLLPKHSPFEATQRLRRIAEDLFLVETVNDPAVWKMSLVRWEKEYGFMLREKTIAPSAMTRTWWYTHGNVRRAWRLLTHDQEPLFVFVRNLAIPKTNNSLEGVNSNLKQKLGNHRGMNIQRQASFLSWYMAFTRIKTDADLKKLWGYWKNKNGRN